MKQRQEYGKEIDRKAYTVKEVAEVLGIGKASAYNLVNRDGFPVLTFGKKKIIPIEAFDKWLLKHSGEDLG